MTTKINLLAVSLFLPVFISAQNVIPEPAQYRPAKGEFVLSIAENKALETNNVLPSRVVQCIAPDCTTGADEAYRLEITPDSVFIQSATVTGAFRGARLWARACFCIWPRRSSSPARPWTRSQTTSARRSHIFATGSQSTT